MDAKKIKKGIIEWIRNYFKWNTDGKAVIGISGGKDSTICAALLVEALGADRVIGVTMPCFVNRIRTSEDSTTCIDQNRLAEILGINICEIDLTASYFDILKQTNACYDTPDLIKTNMPARLRMATLYTVAAMYPNSRVVNTSNKSEKYLGYSTKWGDNVGDFSILGDLTYTEVIELGNELKNIPKDLIYKAPSDGMSGKSDEDKLGFTYAEVDNLILNNLEGPNYVKITKLHQQNLHKIEEINTFKKDSI